MALIVNGATKTRWQTYLERARGSRCKTLFDSLDLLNVILIRKYRWGGCQGELFSSRSPICVLRRLRACTRHGTPSPVGLGRNVANVCDT